MKISHKWTVITSSQPKARSTCRFPETGQVIAKHIQWVSEPSGFQRFSNPTPNPVSRQIFLNVSLLQNHHTILEPTRQMIAGTATD